MQTSRSSSSNYYSGLPVNIGPTQDSLQLWKMRICLELSNFINNSHAFLFSGHEADFRPGAVLWSPRRGFLCGSPRTHGQKCEGLCSFVRGKACRSNSCAMCIWILCMVQYAQKMVTMYVCVDDTMNAYARLILGLCPANERPLYFVTTSLIGWVQS